MKKAISGIMLTMLIIGMVTLAFDIQQVKAIGTIYVRADGSIDPPTAPIQRNGAIYTFTDNIYNKSIVIERDNIIIDGNNHILQGPAEDGISGSGRSNVTIKNMLIARFSDGIDFSGSGLVVTNVTIIGCWEGIWLPSCSDANITGNILKYNNDGIQTPGSGVITNNIITNNGYGLLITVADVVGNKILRNYIGIYGLSPTGTWTRNTIINNTIAVQAIHGSASVFHNNFIDNTIAVDPFYTATLTWDNGYPSGGNYWSDYAGMDANEDGIGDTPYIIDSYNQDRYPLMNLPVLSDVAVTSLTSSKTVVGQGYSTPIDVTVENQGDFTETFDVTLYTQLQEAINETGLVGHWSFDEGTGTVANDSSGNNNHGTLMNGPTWVDGKIGKALSFDGIDDYVEVPNSASLNVNTQITITAWIKINSGGSTAQRFIVDKGDGGQGYWFWIRHEPYRHLSLRLDTSDFMAGDPIPYDEWHHVAITYDGSTIIFYEDGQPFSGGYRSGPIQNCSESLWIGNGLANWGLPPPFWNGFDGVIDEIKIYSRALSADEVWAEYSRALIATQTVTLESGSSTTLTFTWDTTGFAKGNYIISAYALPVLGETVMNDNTLVNGTVRVGVPCDVTGPIPLVPDDVCNMRDIGYFCANFMTDYANCDVTGLTPYIPDGIVNMRDIGEACNNFMKTDP